MVSVASTVKLSGSSRNIRNRGSKVTSRRYLSTNIISFPWVMIVELALSLGLIVLLILLRYTYIDSQLKPKIELAKLAATGIDQYNHILSVNIAMLEFIKWENESEIHYMSPLRYYYKKMETFKSRVLSYNKKVLSDSTGSNHELVYKVLNTKTCDIFDRTFIHSEEYPNCYISLAGQAKNSLIEFLRQYPKLVDRFMLEWQVTTTYQERLELTSREEFASMIAYVTHDGFGMADAMFYHLLFPISSKLADRVEELSSQATLANVVLSVLVSIITLTLFRSAYYQFISMQENFWRIIKCVPYHLMQSNMILSNKMRMALLQRVSFTKF